MCSQAIRGTKRKQEEKLRSILRYGTWLQIPVTQSWGVEAGRLGILRCSFLGHNHMEYQLSNVTDVPIFLRSRARPRVNESCHEGM